MVIQVDNTFNPITTHVLKITRTNQLIYTADRLTGFYVKRILALNALNLLTHDPLNICSKAAIETLEKGEKHVLS